ncbi:MAG TPA: sarcosine oxidase subunit gamma family protein [Acidimicrobiales bacterium]|nr:sarcosine oxidase subunit gamma family protein [Acidimicrobiales bacterium]
MASAEKSPGVPVARSPITQLAPVKSHQGWEVSGARSDGPLRLADLTPLTKLLVRSARETAAGRRLDCPFGSTRRDADGSLVIGAGPFEWLVLSPAGSRAQVASDLEAPAQEGGDGELLSVIDMTHGSIVLRLSGTDSHRVLEKVCAIDFAEGVTPNGSCFRSSVARLRCTVARDDLGGERSYLIESDRSSGQYLFDALRDVGAEFSIEVDGYPSKEI